MRIGEHLIHKGHITEDDLAEALAHQQQSHLKLGSILVESGIVDSVILATALEERLGAPAAGKRDLESIHPETLAVIPREIAIEHMLLPFRIEGKRLSIAMRNPNDILIADRISFDTGFIVRPYTCPEVILARALAKHHNYSAPLLKYDSWSSRLKSRRSKQTVTQQQHNNAPFGISTASVSFSELPCPEEKSYSLKEVCHQFTTAATKDQVADIYLKAMSQYFESVGIFVFKGQNIAGWHGILKGIRQRNYNTIVINKTPDILKHMLQHKTPVTGSLGPNIEQHTARALALSQETLAYAFPLNIAGKISGVTLAIAPRLAEPQIAEATVLTANMCLSLEMQVLKTKIMTSIPLHNTATYQFTHY